MSLQKILDWLTPVGLAKPKKIEPIRIEEDENISMPHPQGTTITLFTYRVPQKAKMTLTHFANYLNLPGHWHHVTWTILKNGIGVPPYDALLDQIGYSAQPRLIKRINFNGADELRIIATDDNSIAQPPILATGIAIKYEVI